MAVLSGEVARGDVRAVRVWWRQARPGPGLGQVLDRAYMIVIGVALLAAFGYGSASAVLAEWITPRGLAVWGPSAVLVVLVLGARWGAYQGPVVFGVADVATLLGAPLSRRRLATPRLLRAFAIGAGACAVVAALLIVGLAGDHRGIAVGDALGLAAGLALAGVLAVVAAEAVERSPTVDRWSRWARWPALLLAVLLGVWASGDATGARVALWSGPWGWAIRAGTDGPASRRGLALVLLALLTVATAALAVRSCGRTPTERHLRRAQNRAGTQASLMTFDARSARTSLLAGSAQGARRLPWSPPLPERPGLAVAWRDVVAHLAAPHQLVTGVVLGAAAGAIALLGSGPAPVLGALVAYVAAAALIEPLRAELDIPSRPRILLRAPVERLLLLHTAVPMVLLAAISLIVGGAVAAAGALPADGVLRVVLLVASVPAIVLCAANSSRRGGKLSVTVLLTASSDSGSGMGGMLVAAWLVVWPAVAVVCGGVPGLIVAHGGAVGSAIVLTAAGPPVLAAILRRTVNT